MTASRSSMRCAPACRPKPTGYARQTIGPDPCTQRPCCARASPIHSSSWPSGRTRPWSKAMKTGARPDARSSAASPASRSSPAPPARPGHGAAGPAGTPAPKGTTGAGAMPSRSRTCGTFPRPAAGPSPSAHRCPPRRVTRPIACGTPCAGWPGGSATRSSASRAHEPTASPGGPSAASASRPDWTPRRPRGR